MGEASLRIAKQINPRANPRWRPVSDLTVGYLIFPGTAERPFSQPNLKRWHERCQALLDEIGGIGEGYVLHEWDDPFNPEPEEVPTTEEGEVATDGESGDGEASAADGGEASGE